MNKIIRQIAIIFYSVGFFELYKYIFPGINKDWIFITLFVSVSPIIILYSLRDHDEWRKNNLGKK